MITVKIDLKSPISERPEKLSRDNKKQLALAYGKREEAKK